ncbi:E3 ubiquitin-protein ligase RNF13-like [Rhopilema esculentum]|uniref:E3 ubiquitin-protein ligase RNF13-like n=1 Tax=Rhopilema esculentum TaxID=499914 RepID=UPI0031DBF8C0
MEMPNMPGRLVLFIYLLWISNLIQAMVISAKVIVEFNASMKSIDDQEAKFGRALPENGMEGYLVVAKPLNACIPIQPPPKGLMLRYVNFFALIEESGCDYSQKVLMAQNSNYRAAIIYEKFSDTPVVMEGGEAASKIFIPSVNIGKSDGESLKNYDYKTHAHIYLQPSMKVPIELYLIPFVVVFGVCFLFMALFSVGRYCRQRRIIRNSRLSRESLKSIPTKKFKKGDDYDICAICLEEFEVGEKLRILPCSHVYHCKCVDPWLTGGKKSCPVCNRPVLVAKKSQRQEQSTSSGGSVTIDSHPPTDDEASRHDTDEEVNERTPLIAAAPRGRQSSTNLSV